MIYRIGNQRLDIPETGTERKVRTPRQVVPYRDMAETCRNLDALCTFIQHKPKTVVDGIARSGFWGAVFRNHWPKCKLVLNGENKECVDILKTHFPDAIVKNEDIKKWTSPKSDLCFLDFDKFTLRTIGPWVDVLKRCSATCRYFSFVDGACFGFKFGTWKHYGIKRPTDYYDLLDKALNNITGKHITALSIFSNAASILLEDTKPREILFLPPTNLLISRGGKIYKQGQSSNKKKRLF